MPFTNQSVRSSLLVNQKNHILGLTDLILYQSKPSKSFSNQLRTSQPELDRLRQQKAWDTALAPAKQVPMQAFMMWMSGSGVQIFR